MRRYLIAAIATLAVLLLGVAPAVAQLETTPGFVSTLRAVPYVQPIPSTLDDFDWGAATTSIAGHQPAPNGLTWVLENAGSPGTTSAIKLDGSGHASTGGVSLYTVENYLTLPSSATNILVTTRSNFTGTIGAGTAMWGHAEDFLKVTGSSTTDALAWTHPSVVRLNFRTGAGNASETSKHQINGTVAFSGDSLTRHYYPGGAGWLLDYALNGEWQAFGVDITAYGADYTSRNFGFLGNFGITSGSTGTSLIDLYQLADLGTQSTLMLRLNYRVAPLSVDGSLTQHLVGQYWGKPLTAARVTLCYLDSTQAPISGLCGLPARNFSASNGYFSFDGPTIASGSVPGVNFTVRVCRTDTTPAICSYSAILKPGEQYGGYGQSLWIYGAKATSFSPSTGLTNMYRVDASTCNSSNCIESTGNAGYERVRTIPDTSPQSALAAVLEGVNGGLAISIVNGGKGGTNAYARVPGASAQTYEQFVDGLVNRAGKEMRGLFVPDGESDADAPGTGYSSYVASNLSIFRGIKAVLGHDYIVCLRPVASFWVSNGSQDPQWEATRRLQTKMAIDYASGDATTPPIKNCGYAYEHKHQDNYHPDDGTFGVDFARMAFNMKFYETGTASLAHLGPAFKTATAPSFTDATHIAVVFTVDAGMTGLDVLNKATSAEGAGGGLWFKNSSSFVRPALGCVSSCTSTQDHIPTGVSCSNTGTNEWTCAFAFSGGAWTTGDHAYVGGPWGAEPFNPTHDTSYHGTELTKESVLQETFADGTTAPVQPYYNFAGNVNGSDDYLVSSNTCP